MKLNKLLDRQLRKFFPEEKYNEKTFKQFIEAVNDSYNAYERDHELANRAFRISEDEYMQINEQLTGEIELKKASIDKLKEVITEIGEGSFNEDGDELLGIATYLKLQIGKRKKAEEDLRRLSMVASLNSNGVLFTDATGNITWANDGFSELTGYTSAEATGRTPVEILYGEKTDRGTVQEMVDLFFKGKSFDVELVCYKKDGSSFWGRAAGQPVFDEDGKAVQFFAVIEDITSEKMAQERLKVNEEKYRNIIANMNLGLLEIDLDETIQYANNSFCEMSGFDLDEIIGRKAAGLFIKGESIERAETKNDLRKKRYSDVYEIAVKNKRGELKWWLISTAPRYNDHGNLVGSIGIHLDITDQKKLEIDLSEAREAAEQSAKAKELFLANMSHEIRTPMNAILGMGRQLQKTELNENQHFFLDTINKAAEHLLVVINDILDISKIEAGKLNLESIGFRPEQAISHCVQVMSHKAEEKGLRLHKEISEGISTVLIGDPYRLNQVLLNLISNAVKFTEKGSITVSCYLLRSLQNRQTICIEVKDTGIGMDEEFSSRLFQKFTQEEKSTARKYGGTGLGMSISKQLVELMGGTINVKSKKGAGTEILLTIPFVTGSKADLPEDNREVSDSAVLKDKKILLVEDNVMNRLVAKTVLKQYEVIITEAVNGEEAVNALRQSPYDIVLMDVQMPVMDGLEATRIIRKDINEDIPIIALTANAIKGESDRCIEAGMNDFVSKPFEEKDLVYAMAKWINYTHDLKTGNMNNNTEKKQPLYDLSKLEKIGNGDKVFVSEMVKLFKDQVPADVNQIKAAYSRNDFTAINAIAHRIKPAIDNMGIVSLHQEIRKIESVALQEPHSPELAELIKELDAVISLVVEELG
jgi:two-component system, sensor histidine kinase